MTGIPRLLWRPRVRPAAALFLFCLTFAAVGILVPAAYAQAPEDAPAVDEAEDEDELDWEGGGRLDPDAFDGVEELVVTEERREVRLTEYVSVTSFSKDAIEANQIEELSDYFDLTPNVTFTNNGNRARTQVSIRGVGNIGGRANTFGVYVDGFNIAPGSSTRTYDPNLVDVERIDVLRGPQGTYFGRNTTAGAIAITSVKPGPRYEARMEAEYASFNARRVRGVLNVPLTDETLFVRIAGYYEGNDGIVENIGPSGGESDFDAWGLRAALRFQPTTAFTTDLSIRATALEQGLDAVVQRDTVSSELPNGPFEIELNGPNGAKNDGLIIANNARFDAKDFTIESISGYVDNRYVQQNDDDEGVARTSVQTSVTQLQSFSQEFRLLTDFFDQVEFVSGAFASYDRQKIESRRTEDNPIPGRPPRDTIHRALQERTTAWAAYVHATWSVHSRVDLTFGGRYSGVRYERNDQLRPLNGSPQADPFFRADLTDHDFSYRVAVAFEVTDETRVYARHSTAFRNGGSNGPQTNLPDTFQPEKIRTVEVGVRTTFWEDRVLLNAAAFYYEWDDLQVVSFDFAAATTATLNASSAWSTGFEIELGARPIEELELSFGAGFLRSEFDEFQFSDTLSLDGRTLPRAPRWTLNATAQYTFPLPFAPGIDAFVRGEWTFVDSRIRGVDGVRLEAQGAPNSFALPSYQVANLRGGLEWDNFRLVFYAENFVDANYFTGVRRFNLLDPNPRVIGGRLTVKY
ncbi:MAG: TonB-dependent receptor [Myxococcota bacterium]